MSLVLYYSPFSSSSRVQWALEELGVGYEAVRVDLKAGQQRTPEFLKLNPNGKVPVLVVDGQPMFESLAMLWYLAEHHGEAAGLYPRGAARLEIMQWLSWSQVTFGAALGHLLRELRAPEPLQDARKLQEGRVEVERLLGMLEEALTGREYLTGSFSIADIGVAGYALFLPRLGFDLSRFPRVEAWGARCHARPAWQRLA